MTDIIRAAMLSVVVLSFLLILYSIVLTENERKVKIRNETDKLFDNTRFCTDRQSRFRFRRIIVFLLKYENYKKSIFMNAAKRFMKIAKKTSDPLDKAYSLGWAGKCYEDYGEYATAALCYSAAVELAPSDVFALERLGDYFFDSDSEVDTKNESLESVKRYKQVLEYDPLSARAYYKLGKTYSMRGDNDEAISQYKKSIEVNNAYISSMAETAIEYAKKKDRNNSLKFFCLAMANDLSEFDKLEETIKLCLEKS
ncbi:MAG: tetratricopeptide repeat protein [Oscillospiraceae bacterium]|jgi:tetratricopeptide (TPR) repeat protein|nr:tetratricopeptide repeat protein [Oscillospiraceae bacterium]